MDKIRMVKDENGDIFLSQEDLVKIMNDRLERFPQEYEELKKPQEGSIVGVDGKKNLVAPDPAKLYQHEGMEKMLRGIVGILSADPGGEKNDD